MITYLGIDRKGAGISGIVPPNIALEVFIQRKYRAGWRELHAIIDQCLVGAIEPHPEKAGRRIWWCEKGWDAPDAKVAR